MGLFDFISNKRYSEQEVAGKLFQGISAYQQRDFPLATKLFREYFKMRGLGNFLRLDADDYRMRMNLVMAEFYSKDYTQCKADCDLAMRINSNAGDPYALRALSDYKLGNVVDAIKYWTIAKSKGSALANSFD